MAEDLDARMFGLPVEAGQPGLLRFRGAAPLTDPGGPGVLRFRGITPVSAGLPPEPRMIAPGAPLPAPAPQVPVDLAEQGMAPPAPPPFTWEQLESDDGYRSLDAPGRFKVKRSYWQDFVARTGMPWEAWDRETAPGALVRTGRAFAGAMEATAGQLQQTAGMGARLLGAEQTGQEWLERGRQAQVEGARASIPLPYGGTGWRQFLNAVDPRAWPDLLQKLVAEGIPGTLPSLAGGTAGAVAGTVFLPGLGTVAGGLLGAMLGVGGAAFLQSVGSSYDQYLQAYPGDEDGAVEYALTNAGAQGIFESLSVPLGVIGHSLSAVKHTLVQMAVQSLHGGLSQVVQNVGQQTVDPSVGLADDVLFSAAAEAGFEAPALVAGYRYARKLQAPNPDLPGRDEGGLPPGGLPPGGPPPPGSPPPLFGGAPGGAEPPPPGAPPAGMAPSAAAPLPGAAFAPSDLAAAARNLVEQGYGGEGLEALVNPPSAPAPAEARPPAPAPAPEWTDLDVQAHQAATSPLNDLPEPTEPQKDAGNYQKGHFRWNGLEISIENPAGSTRSGTDRQGRPWEALLADHYGYIRRTAGRDGDQVDMFMGPHPDSGRVFVIDQVDPQTRRFDEHKVMLGFQDEEAAREGYLASYEPGWQGLGNIEAMSLDEFKAWLSEGDTTRRITARNESSVDEEKPEVTGKQPGQQGVGEPAAPRARRPSMADMFDRFGKPAFRTGDRVMVHAFDESKPGTVLLDRSLVRLDDGMVVRPRPDDVNKLEPETPAKPVRQEAQEGQETVQGAEPAPGVSPLRIEAQGAPKDEAGLPGGEDVNIRAQETGHERPTAEAGPRPARPAGPEALAGASAEDVRPPAEGGPPAPSGGRGGTELPGGGPADLGGPEGPGAQPRAGGDVGTGNPPAGVHPAAGRGERGGTAGREPAGGRGTGAEPEAGTGERGAGREPAGAAGHDLLASDRGHNYHIADTDALGEGGPVAKFEDNLRALRVLKQVEAEGRPATAEEQATLVKYVGWGGLPQVFNRYQADRNWAARADKLADLLTQEEFAQVRATVLNAHYTSRPVIQWMYRAIERLGFQQGRILEPGAGVGHFLGIMPKEMAAQSRTAAVELDSVTARIGQLLYPETDFRHSGYQDALFPENYFDLAISNVPFSNDVKLKWKKQLFNLHNFFFAKALDETRPGGLVAFITSTGTLDAQGNEGARRYLAERADLVAAFRLPDTAFQQNALTQVTTDVLFLQKRESGAAPRTEPEWVAVEKRPIPGAPGEEATINEYYRRHPEHVLGGWAQDKLHPNRLAVHAAKEELPGLLDRALAALPEGRYRSSTQAQAESKRQAQMIPAPDDVKQGGYTVREGRVYRRVGAVLEPVRVPAKQLPRVQGLINLRGHVRNLLRLQIEDRPEAAIKSAQKNLGRFYEAFVNEHGPVSSLANRKAFDADPDYPLLTALERYDPDTNTAAKTDFFTKRTIQKPQPVTQVESAAEAMLLSLNEHGALNPLYMSRVTGKDWGVLQEELKGRIFQNPESDQYEPADQYLSGNVRRKLALAESAAKTDPAFGTNVEALRAVQPEDLAPGQINVRPGAPWLPNDIVEDFAGAVLGIRAAVRHSEDLGIWKVDVKGGYSAANDQEWGHARFRGDDLLELALNQQLPTVYDRVDNKQVVNAVATAGAREKQAQLIERFGKWVWEDDARAARLARLYNDTYNNVRLRQYDGAHLKLPGMNPNVQLRPHQKDAIWRILQSPNTGLAHVVGAGKTWVMAAAAMELRRLGLAKKPMFVVPNHMIEQFSTEFLHLYPAANVLAAGKADFAGDARRKLMSRIATGDWDAVIVAHSSFGKLPVSRELEEEHLNRQIDGIIQVIEAEKADSGRRGNRMVKELEASRKRLEGRLKALQDATQRDDTVNFEELGVDRLFVDEAHEFKNLFVHTRQRNVAGIQTTESGKAWDLFMKVQWLQRENRGGGAVFSTATPVSNTMAELFTMQRYLQPEALAERGVTHFDGWAGAFGQTVAALELAPSGQGYRVRTRFARFNNLPELMQMFRSVWDVQTAEMLNLPRPKIAGGKPKTVSVPASDALKRCVQSLVARAEKIRTRQVDPRQDNMLNVTTDGRKAALDLRLVGVADIGQAESGNKVRVAIDNIHRIWEETADRALAQLVFIDFSAPKKKGEGFSVYTDIKERLVELGVPAEQVAFIHDANTDDEKAALFEKVRQGQVRILLGSTPKMGQGTNVQKKLIALHHLDAPWRPSDIEQRNGRIVRQGNENPEVQIYQYVTAGSFDGYMWQALENKARFIDQVLTGQTDLREVEDVDGRALTYAEVKAIASGNPKVMEKAKVDNEVAKLSLLAKSHGEQQWKARSSLQLVRAHIESLQRKIPRLEADAKAKPDLKGDQFALTIRGTIYDERKAAGERLLATLAQKPVQGDVLGAVGPFRLLAGALTDSVVIRGEEAYPIVFSTETGSGTGAAMAIQNAVERIAAQAEGARRELAKERAYLQELTGLVGKPFERQQELAALKARQAELNQELDLDQKKDPIIAEEAEGGEGEGGKEESRAPRAATGGRPALNLDALRARLEAQAGKTIALRLFGELPDRPQAAGYRSRAQRAIGLSYWAQDPQGVIDHEAWHELLDRLAPLERQVVERAFGEGSHASRRVEAGLAERAYTAALADPAYLGWPERSAYAYQFYRQNAFRPAGPLKRVFDAITNWLGRLHNALEGMGFQTVQDIFRAASRGEYAERPLAPAASEPHDLSSVSGNLQGGKGPDDLQESRAGRVFGTALQAARAQPTVQPQKWTDRVLSIPFRLMPVHKIVGAAVDHALERWVPESVKAGLWDRYGQTEEQAAGRWLLNANLQSGARRVQGLVERMLLNPEESAIAHEWMQVKPDATREQELLSRIPEASRQALQEAKALIRDLGREAVRLGQLTQESFERNELAYLHRLYREHELTRDGSLPAWRRAAQRIIGNQLKGRGMWDPDVTLAHLTENAPDFWIQERGDSLARLKGERFLRYNLWKQDRLVRHAYVPTGVAESAQLDRFTRPGSGWVLDVGADGAPNAWEVRHQKPSGRLILWRDFTKAEREQMGEITEVRYAVTRTLLAMTRDVELGRYFEWITRHRGADGQADWALESPERLPAGAVVVEAKEGLLRPFRPNEWVEVPPGSIPQTPGVKKYGALAGKLVPGPIWNELRQVANWNQHPFGEAYARLLTFFKTAKTAWTPPVHLNNVAANFLFADMADLRSQHLLAALRTAIQGWRGDAEARRTIQRIQDSGALSGNFAQQELRREVLQPVEEALRKELLGQTGDSSEAGALTRALALLDLAMSGLRKAGRAGIDIYQFEDNLFRMAMFLQRVEEGATDMQAAKAAREAFLDYDISAPWVNLARQTVLPFIAFPYRAIPKLYETAKTRPWKLLKWFLVMGALQGIGNALAGGDDEYDRALLPDEKAGKIFGIFPRLFKMPWRGKGGSPLFLDIARFIPGGDMLMWEQGHSALPVLPFLMPGGPLQLAAELLLNVSSYTGQPIVKETDTPREQAMKAGLHVYRGLMPNVFAVPRNYAWDQVGFWGSDRMRMDPFGREYPTLLAWANAFGLKLAEYPRDVLQLQLMKRTDHTIRELRAELHLAGLRYLRGGIGKDAYESRVQDLVGRIREQAQQAQEKLNRGQSSLAR